MACRLCQFLCDRLSDSEVNSRRFWRVSGQWEADHSNDWELWEEDGEDVQKQIHIAQDLIADDKPQALAAFKSLADEGSVWAMRRVGLLYQNGWGGKRDLKAAEDYYYRALLGGSWSASVELARLLFDHKINEKWEGILENGVESDFVPANFWLARFRYERRPSRRTARLVRPLLDRAVQAGHPGARLYRSRLKGMGKYGLRNIREGFHELGPLMEDFRSGKLRIYDRGDEQQATAEIAAKAA